MNKIITITPEEKYSTTFFSFGPNLITEYTERIITVGRNVGQTVISRLLTPRETSLVLAYKKAGECENLLLLGYKKYHNFDTDEDVFFKKN